MEPRDIPMEPRASILDVVAGRARLVGSRTQVGRRDLRLVPGLVSPYEVRANIGLRYGDPPIEEARYLRARSKGSDALLLLRWVVVKAVSELMPSLKTAQNRDRIRIGPVDIDSVDTGEVIRQILSWTRQGRSARVFFAHAHALNLAARHLQLQEDFRRADLVLADGVGLRLAATILGWRLPANVNGTDLIPELLRRISADDTPIALIGGDPGVAQQAADAWQRRTPLRLVGAWDGFRSNQDYEAVCREIAQSAPVIVLVGFGSPLQERFAHRFLAQPGVVCITVGGLFDFASGTKPRAPLAWRELGLEWLWRLVHEPRRLGSRYVFGNPEFVARVVIQRLRRRRLTLRSDLPRCFAATHPAASGGSR